MASNGTGASIPPREQIESIVQAAVRRAIIKYRETLDSNDSAMVASVLAKLKDVDGTVESISESLEAHLNTELKSLHDALWIAFENRGRQSDDLLVGRVQSIEDRLTRDFREEFEQQNLALSREIRDSIVEKGVERKLSSLMEKHDKLDARVRNDGERIVTGVSHQNRIQAQINEHERTLKSLGKVSKAVSQLQKDNIELRSRIADLDGKPRGGTKPIDPIKDLRKGDIQEEEPGTKERPPKKAKVRIGRNFDKVDGQLPPMRVLVPLLIAVILFAGYFFIPGPRGKTVTPGKDKNPVPGVETNGDGQMVAMSKCLGTLELPRQDAAFKNDPGGYALAGAIFGRDPWTRVDDITKLAKYVNAVTPIDTDRAVTLDLPDLSIAQGSKGNLRIRYGVDGSLTTFPWAKKAYGGTAKKIPAKQEMYHLWLQLALRPDGGRHNIAWDIGVLSSQHGDTLKLLIKKIRGRFDLAAFGGLIDLVNNQSPAVGEPTEKVLDAVFVDWTAEAYAKQINGLADALLKSPDAAEVDLSAIFKNTRLHAVLCKDGKPTVLGTALAKDGVEKIKTDPMLLQLWLASRFGILRFDGDSKELLDTLSLFVVKTADGKFQVDIAGQKLVLKNLLKKVGIFGNPPEDRINERIEGAFPGGVK